MKSHPQTVSCKHCQSVLFQDILVAYGYLPEQPKGTAALRSIKALSSALKQYQRYAGLDPTGIVDKETRAKFREPRCGMKDDKTLKRGKRYVHQGTRWKKRVSNWSILKLVCIGF